MLFVLMFEWLTLLATRRCLPQIAHCAAMDVSRGRRTISTDLGRSQGARLIGLLAAALSVAGAVGAAGCRRSRTPDGTETASVQGKALSANGRALPGRAILERDSTRGLVRVTSKALDSKGEFELHDLAPGRYLLRAEAAGYATVTVPLELMPGDNLTTSLRLEPEQLLEGVVQDARGQPLVDAVVLAWPMGKRGATVVEARSGKDGKFTLAGLPRGAWTLLAEAPGFGTLELERVDVPSRQLVLRLEGEARSMGGIVVDQNGKNVTGARVALGGSSLKEPRVTTTDARGTFLFRGVGYGKYTLRASHGKASSLPAGQVIDDGTGWMPPFRLMLGDGTFLEGRVIDDGGKPLVNASVEVTALPNDDLPETVTVGADGRFQVGPLPPGRYQALARVPDHVLVAPREVRLRVDGTASVELRLSRAAGLSGRAVDELGAPIAGVGVSAVSLSSAGNDELAVLAGTLPLAAEAAELPPRSLARPGNLRTTTTDARGRFQLDELPPGRTRLELQHPQRLPVRREPILLGAGGRQDLGDLVVATGAVLVGRVLDEAGRPLDGARVEARGQGKKGDGPFRVSTGTDGRFTLRLPGGDYSVVAVAPAHAPQSIFALHAVPGAPAPPLELRLARADGMLEGTVREASGRAVTRASLVVLAAPPGLGDPAGTAWRPRSTAEIVGKNAALPLASGHSDYQGKFKLRGLPRGPLILEVRHNDFAAIAAVISAGEKVALKMARPGGIEGEIREGGSGAFVARYELQTVGPEGRQAERVEKQGAGFSIMGLQPGKWTLKVVSPGFAPVEQEVNVPASQSKREPSIKDLRIDLNRGGTATAAP
jgi:hypothetical protein